MPAFLVALWPVLLGIAAGRTVAAPHNASVPANADLQGPATGEAVGEELRRAVADGLTLEVPALAQQRSAVLERARE
jgi:hypothetical protein